MIKTNLTYLKGRTMKTVRVKYKDPKNEAAKEKRELFAEYHRTHPNQPLKKTKHLFKKERNIIGF